MGKPVNNVILPVQHVEVLQIRIVLPAEIQQRTQVVDANVKLDSSEIQRR